MELPKGSLRDPPGIPQESDGISSRGLLSTPLSLAGNTAQGKPGHTGLVGMGGRPLVVLAFPSPAPTLNPPAHDPPCRNSRRARAPLAGAAPPAHRDALP